GFCNIDDRGLEGLELMYDSLLYGLEGKREFERDALGKRINKPGMLDIPAQDGLDVYLTIDSIIQHIVETELDNLYKEHKPLSASVVVMNPQNGEILAFVICPAFDPNSAALYSPEVRRNKVITDMYEPGSTFKTFTFTALFDENLVSTNEIVFCENGLGKFGRRTLRDHTPHADISVIDVIALSSNIGTAKCAQRLSEEQFYSHVKNFGFSLPTGIDLPGEADGFLAPVNKWSKYTHVSLSIGQEINVTPIQMITAFSAVANGGTLYKPALLKYISNRDGTIVRESNPVVIKKVCLPETTAILKQALFKVVEEGTGKRAKSKLYTIAGKTGTAQKSLPGERGYSNKYVASFVAFAPVDSPRIAVIVVADQPSGKTYFGGSVAAPTAGVIIEKILTYLKVQPDKETKDDNTKCAEEHNKPQSNRGM
ncbi:MAG: penicillin-binding transpeptidase domain-containing protein, partial [Planctomycetota bacterium]